ncbi:MAG: hypothetical protein ACRBB6_10780 [Neptuniibacter sp.]
MNVHRQTLLDSYFKLAMKPLIKSIRLPFFIKRKFIAAAIKLHQENASHKERVETLTNLIGNKDLVWARGVEQLLSEKKEPTIIELVRLFVENTSFNTYRIYKQEELKAHLKSDENCQVRVSVSVAFSGNVAPCGKRHGEILENTKATLKAIPPCSALRCACDWEVTSTD